MYKKVKEEICDIISIVKDCPEALQEKCFELLLNHLLSDISIESPKKVETLTPKSEIQTLPVLVAKTNSKDDENEVQMTDFHIKTRRFLESNGIANTTINNLYYKEDGQIRPLYEDLKTNKMAESQIKLALLTAFENSIINDGELFFQGEDVRKRCQEMKCYDGSNFAAIFKNNAILFDGFEKYEKGKRIDLSTEEKRN